MSDARTELNKRYESAIPMLEDEAREFKSEYERLYGGRFVVAMDAVRLSYIVVQLS